MKRRLMAGGSVTVTIVAIIIATHTLWIRGQTSDQTKLEAIADARDDRQLAARPSGSFAYRPLIRRRSTAAANKNGQLTAVVARTKDLVATLPSAANFRGLGRANLLAGRTEMAIVALEDALRTETGEEDPTLGIGRSADGALLVDLSAAYYTDATNAGHAYALPAAIESAERAIQLDGDSESALWNRALALDAFGALDDARASWDKYLRLDASSEWAKEARQRRAELQRQRDEALWPKARDELQAAARSGDIAVTHRIVARFPSRSVALVERQLLPSWGRSMASGNAAATLSELKAARCVSEAIADTLHDPLLREVTRDGRAGIAALYRAFGELTPATAAAELSRLRDAATRLRSPLAIRFALALAVNRYEGRDHRTAIAELDTLTETMLRGYPVSLAQSYWYRGLAEASLGYVTDALASYSDAAAIYESIGDSGLVGAMALMRGDAADYAGDLEQAWSAYVVAMREIDLHGNRTMLDNVTFAAARSSLRRGYPNAALILQSRYVDRLRHDARPEYLCQALIARCDTYSRLGRGKAAQQDCRDAASLFASLTDPSARGRLESDLHVATAAAEASSKHAVEPLTAALQVAVGGGDHFRIARLYLARARAFVADHRDTEGENDLRNADMEIEEQRQKLNSDDFRVFWLDAARATHKELVSLLLRTGRIGEAFEVADRARARVALDRLSPDVTGPILPRLRARLPEDAAFVEFWVSSDDEVVAWVVTRTDTTCRQFKVRGLVRRIRAAIEGYELRASGTPVDGDRDVLFDELVRPWIGDVQRRRLLLISADFLLADVPFSALRDRSRNAALIADHAVVMEPSAAIFVSGKETAEEVKWRSAVVVVGEAVPGQPRLDTQQESMAVRQAGFQNARVIRRTEATPERFLDLLQKFDVVHFAGHTVETSRQETALVLERDRQHPDGLLRTTEIERTRAHLGSLVVLAACRTSRGRISSDGEMSLARSFLITGSTAVIGSLWDVDDEATGRLFSLFYRYLAAHQAPADALRLAQIDLSKTYPDPRYWAAFQIYGGAS
jgi:CHAT domain-containing protein